MRHLAGRGRSRRPAIRGDEDLTHLVVRAVSGDRAAESAFVARTIDDVWRFCAHQLGPAQADDATQATYLRALRALPSYRGDSSPRTWLIGVARHACLDEVRAGARRTRLAGRLVAHATERPEAVDCMPFDVETDELLHGLSRDRREAFVLTQLLGFSYDEAAQVVGCPVGTIRSRVSRARTDLTVQLEPQADQPAVGGSRRSPMWDLGPESQGPRSQPSPAAGHLVV